MQALKQRQSTTDSRSPNEKTKEYRIGGIKKDILFIDYERFLLNVGCNLFQGHLKLVALPAKGKSQMSSHVSHKRNSAPQCFEKCSNDTSER